ncbi:MAG: histidine phosphatase family protein [Eubacterium sp.]
MEILIIRHGDPDYVHDSLTKKGVREAKLLADRLSKQKIDYIYCSPLGRAQKTASYTLEKTGKSAVTLEWLREFQGTVKKNWFIKENCWDRMPSYWTEIDDYYSYDKWLDADLMKKGDVARHYKKVCAGVDELLKSHGYVHNGRLFDVERESSDVIVLFCHFGVSAVILSHIFNISPMILWHNFRALPTSVTRLVTEEREKGKAIFTCLQYGDLSHLYAGDEEPSFQARFCEKYSDNTRH